MHLDNLFSECDDPIRLEHKHFNNKLSLFLPRVYGNAVSYFCSSKEIFDFQNV